MASRSGVAGAGVKGKNKGLHSVSDKGPKVTSRRSPRLHPQIHSSDSVSAGVTRCCSPRLHPEIESTEEMRCPPVVAASLPDDEDMLREILLRLPPQPSSLPRASAVCRRWRGLVTDPKFHRQFYAHHRKPPILGVFQESREGIIVFTPMLDPPDRIPAQRFSLGRYYSLLDCRHGLVLVKDGSRNEVVVCDPITGEQRRVAGLPFQRHNFAGAVLCAARNQGHVHGGCHLSPFKVVLVSMSLFRQDYAGACVYSSDTDEWGNLISTELPCYIVGFDSHSTLVGNILYWLISGDRILEFDLDRQNLAVTVRPSVDFPYFKGQIIHAEDGVVGFAIFRHSLFQTWKRNINCQGVATWVPWKTIEMHNILGLSLQIGGDISWLMGYDEDNDVIFVHAGGNVYMVQFKLMQSRKLYESCYVNHLHPFNSFYTPAIHEGDEADMLHGSIGGLSLV